MKKLISVLLTLLSVCILFSHCGKKPSGNEAEASSIPSATQDASIPSTQQPFSPATQQPSVPSTQEAGVPSTQQPTVTQPAGKALTYEEVYNPYTDFNNAVGRCCARIFDIGDAYLFPGSSANYLYYYDKAVGESAVLCPKPECVHDQIRDNKDCGGYINGDGAVYLNYYMGQIYFISYENNGKDMYLNRMNIDTTGRERLFKIDYETQYFPQRAYIHRGKLYGVGLPEIVRDGSPICSWNISSWDLETGEYKLIYEEDTLSEPCLFFFGKYVYFCASSIKFKQEDGDDIDTQTVKIFRYDTEEDRVEKLADCSSGSFRGGNYQLWVAAEDRIYTAPLGMDVHPVPTAVYRVSDGQLVEVTKVKEGLYTTLFGDMIVGWGKRYDPEHPEKPLNCQIQDYDGNLLYEGQLPLDILYGVARIVDKNVFEYGMLETDGALFIVYDVTVTEELGGEPQSYDCVVRYKHENGKLEETFIGAAKWN